MVLIIFPGLGKAAPRGRISLVNIRCSGDNYLKDNDLIDDGHGDGRKIVIHNTIQATKKLAPCATI